MRNIIEGPHFAECVRKLGGHRIIDEAMEPIIEALSNNPYGFTKVQNDWCDFRYVRTQAIDGHIPSLVLVFVIDSNKDVVLEWIDEIDDAEYPG